MSDIAGCCNTIKTKSSVGFANMKTLSFSRDFTLRFTLHGGMTSFFWRMKIFFSTCMLSKRIIIISLLGGLSEANLFSINHQKSNASRICLLWTYSVRKTSTPGMFLSVVVSKLLPEVLSPSRCWWNGSEFQAPLISRLLPWLEHCVLPGRSFKKGNILQKEGRKSTDSIIICAPREIQLTLKWHVELCFIRNYVQDAAEVTLAWEWLIG